MSSVSTREAREVDEAGAPASGATASTLASLAQLTSSGPAGLSAAQVMRLQREAGNRVVARAILARQEKPAATDADVLAWPTTLPKASRGAGEALSVTMYAKKKDPTLNNEAAGGNLTGLDATKQAVVGAIAKARGDFLTKLAPSFRLNPYSAKTGSQWGWMYVGQRRGLSADPTPTALASPAAGADLKRVAAQKAIWDELQSEGGAGSINTYDEQIFTWGRGLGAASGPAGSAMDVAIADTTVKNAFLRIGVTRQGGAWWIVNTANGAIETGDEALQLLAGREDILAAIAGVTESDDVRQKAVDAQWDYISKNAADVPSFAYDWDPHVIQVVAHITHGGPKYGWGGKNRKLYEDTKGNMAEVLVAWGSLRCEGAESPSGAYKVSTQTDLTAQWIRKQGGGISAKTLATQGSGPLDVSDEKIKTDSALAKHLVLKMPEGGYYILPKLTPQKEAELGKNVHADYLTRLDQMPMKDMLPAIEKLGGALLLDHFFSIDAYIHAAPITNEERLWWAYKVVRFKSVPPVPAPVKVGSETQVLVYDDQVADAYRYLKQPVPKKYQPKAEVARTVLAQPLPRRRTLARAPAPFVNSGAEITRFYSDGNTPDAAQLKQAVDMQTDIDKLNLAEIAAREALDAAAKTGQPVDQAKLAELTKLRRATEQALVAQVALLSGLQTTFEANAAAKKAAAPADDAAKAKPAKKKGPTPEDIVLALWGPVASNPLEAAKAQLDRLQKWELRLQIADLTAQIAKLGADEADKKKELVAKRHGLVDQLRKGVHDIKQFSGPWAEWDYKDKAGKSTFDYDTGQTAKMRSSACGPTSLAVVLDYLSESDPEGLLNHGQDLHGSDLVKWALDYSVGAGAHAVKPGTSYKGTKYETEGGGMEGSEGTSGNVMADALQKTLGSLRGVALGTDTDKAKDQLDQGNLIVVLGPGHFVVMDDYKDGTGAGTGFHIVEVGNKFGSTGWTNDWAATRATEQAEKDKNPDKKVKVHAAFAIQGMWAISGGY